MATLRYKKDNQWIDLFYPIGSVYFSIEDISPASSVGGTWQKITGRFIRADTTATNTGGSNSHSHTYGVDWVSYYGTMADYHQTGETYLGLWNDGANTFVSGDLRSLPQLNGVVNTAMQTNTKNVSGLTHMGTTLTITANNIPSYYTVCMWVRTA